MEEILKMSAKEIDRFALLKQVLEKKLTQKQAAKILNITDRQIRNLLKSVNAEGARGIISKKRGCPGNHMKPKELKKKVLSLVRSKYEEFGPTFASEKLEEIEGIKVNSETLRLWMIESHLWIPKRKNNRTHPPRRRRSCFGEMIQVDGSHHKWFGENGPMVTLLVFIDDATSKITSLHFCKEETVDDYFAALEAHLVQNGIPRSIYSDRLKVFNGEKYLSQFQQALSFLGIKSILAATPQAKGRVERVNRTLQDRLVKELALNGIETMEEANQFLNGYLERHNKKFSIEPASSFEAHRPLEKGLNLERFLCRREERTLTKDYVFQFNNKFYKIKKVNEIRSPKGVRVEVRNTRKGQMRVFLKDKELDFSPLETIVSSIKEEPVIWKQRDRKAVSNKHPWKNYSSQKETKEYELCGA